MGIETALNLSLRPAVASRLAKHPLLSDAKPIRQRVTNTYYDTADQRLRGERVVVRQDRKGSNWLSSVHRMPLPDGRQRPGSAWETKAAPGPLDFSHVDDDALRAWLESLRDELRPAFTTRCTRSAWLLEPRAGVRIELALERGWIEAQGRRQAICEVGLELLSGGVSDLFSTAGELQMGLSLHPEAASRSQRGYRVMAGESLQAVKAQAIATQAGMTVIAAFRGVAVACLNHLQSNERGLHESDSPEFVHQARVAIRRLRSAMRVWKKRLPQEFVARFDPCWQELARELGDTRNWDVFIDETLPSIVAAFPESVAIARLSQHAQERRSRHRQAARRRLQAADYSRLLLDFTAAVLALPDSDPRRLDAFAPRCLDKRARQVMQMAEQALDGDAPARHRLRVAYKRLRYALEFFAPLFPGAAAAELPPVGEWLAGDARATQRPGRGW